MKFIIKEKNHGRIEELQDNVDNFIFDRDTGILRIYENDILKHTISLMGNSLNKPVSGYVILKSTETKNLEEGVNKLLSLGWKLHGNLVYAEEEVNAIRNIKIFIQALTKN